MSVDVPARPPAPIPARPVVAGLIGSIDRLLFVKDARSPARLDLLLREGNQRPGHPPSRPASARVGQVREFPGEKSACRRGVALRDAVEPRGLLAQAPPRRADLGLPRRALRRRPGLGIGRPGTGRGRLARRRVGPSEGRRAGSVERTGRRPRGEPRTGRVLVGVGPVLGAG